MTAPRKIENMDDVHEALAEIKATLAEVRALDLDAEGAEILFEPLLELQAALTVTHERIAAFVAEREGA